MGVINKTFALTANGSTDKHNVPVSSEYMFYGVGGFGGGTLQLEASPDNGINWFTVETLTKPGRLIRYLVGGEKIRITLSGATGATITTGLRQ